jgi:hypothetical protein
LKAELQPQSHSSNALASIPARPADRNIDKSRLAKQQKAYIFNHNQELNECAPYGWIWPIALIVGTVSRFRQFRWQMDADSLDWETASALARHFLSSKDRSFYGYTENTRSISSSNE